VGYVAGGLLAAGAGALLVLSGDGGERDVGLAQRNPSTNGVMRPA
jgi:hypothetical protein